MSGLILKLREPTYASTRNNHTEADRSHEQTGTAPRLDLFGVVPDRLLGLDLPSIAALPIKIDDRATTVGEQFEIIDEGRSELILVGDYSRCDRLGGSMVEGRMVVQSTVGNYVADAMRGGTLVIAGSAADYACSNLRGGVVQIAGDVGDYCAGASPGNRRGMRGGTLVIRGNAGRYLGYRMRRGTVVAHSAQLGLAAYMIAGTIVVMESMQATLANGMRRGTLITLQEAAPTLSVGFTPWEPIHLSYLHLLVEYLQPLLPNPSWLEKLRRPYSRSLGDRASGGMGEIIWFHS